MAAIRDSARGVILRVEVVTGASESSWIGYDGWRKAVKVRIAAPPREGKANEELLRFVADSIAVPRAGVSLVSGGKSRQKELLIVGIDAASLSKRLEEAEER